MSVNLRWKQFASWRRKNGLFCAIVSWIIIAIIAYTLLSAIWGYGHGWSRILAGWRIGATHDPLDRIKVTLTALGGVGAVGYLVIKYRERAALERGEADEKLVRAVQQLGDPSPQVRIAGVYALADVADTYEGPYHQRVVDILCGYLRTDRLLKDANGDTRYATNDDGTLNYDQPLSEDGAVESTAITIGGCRGDHPGAAAKSFPTTTFVDAHEQLTGHDLVDELDVHPCWKNLGRFPGRGPGKIQPPENIAIREHDGMWIADINRSSRERPSLMGDGDRFRSQVNHAEVRCYQSSTSDSNLFEPRPGRDAELSALD